MSKFTIADLKVKYAAISTGTWNSKQKLTTTKSGQQIRPPSPKEGSFTETERAILLRSVIDAVHSKGVPFKKPSIRCRLIKRGTDFNKFTDLTNTPIQGGCADAVKMAILALEAELPSGTDIVAMLHDELVIETEASIAEEVLILPKQKMEESAGLVFKDVPTLVEGKIVDSWE
jgi:hypothetical protein